MTYSFQLTADTKEAAVQAASLKLDEVLASNPAHAADVAHVKAAVAAFVALLPEDPTRWVSVQLSGYIAGTMQGDAMVQLGTVAMNLTVGMVAKPA